MKILHLSAVKDWGGGEKQIENLHLALNKNTDLQSIILCRKGSILEESIKKHGEIPQTAPVLMNYDFRYVFKIISVCKKHNINILHIHDPRALTLAVIADHFFDLPPFVFSKKTSFPIRKKKATLFKYNYRKLEKILCVSEATKQVSKKSISRHERLEVIYHGTRLDNKSDITSFQLRERLQIPKEKIIIGNIANHIEAKDLETFLKTARYLVHEKGQKNLCFVQMGRFSGRTKKLMQLIQEWNLEDHVFLLGFIRDASNFIPQFNVSLLTSKNEGIPQVIYESFYHGVPVVSTRVGGISEVLEHEVNGLLAERCDYRQLSENILFLIKNSQLIPTFAEVSKKSLEKRFSTEQMAQKTLAQYKKVLHGQL